MLPDALRRRALWLAAAAAFAAGGPLQAQITRPLETAFTFQGELADGGSPAQGNYDLRLRLFDAATGGSQLGDTLTLENVPVAGGRFAVVADFGIDPFDGDRRWLEVAVRPAGTGTFTVLSPRQELTPAPYALHASRSTYTAGTGLELSEGVLSLAFAGSGTAATAARSDHLHDLRYIVRGEPGSVTGPMLATSTVGSVDIAAGGVTAADVGFAYAGSASHGGPASDLACQACVGAADLTSDAVTSARIQDHAVLDQDVSFAYAGSTSQGGPAADLACSSCAGTADLAASAVGSNQIAPGTVAPADVAFAYAGSTSHGGPARDLACSECTQTPDLADGAVTQQALAAGAAAEGQVLGLEGGHLAWINRPGSLTLPFSGSTATAGSAFGVENTGSGVAVSGSAPAGAAGVAGYASGSGRAVYALGDGDGPALRAESRGSGAAVQATGTSGATAALHVAGTPPAERHLPPTQAGWVGTGVTVTTGEHIRIQATGSLCFHTGDCPGTTVGPCGYGGICYDPECSDSPIPGSHHGGLVARIGASGDPFVVCTGGEGTWDGDAPVSGEVQLAINDGVTDDNGGDGFDAVVFSLDAAEAAVFDGDVVINGTLYKKGGSFVIPHPLHPGTMLLRHFFVESAEMLDVYEGRAVCGADGTARVELPRWMEPVNGGFRYLLTPVGRPAPGLHVARPVRDGSFVIGGGSPGLEVCWQISGVRRDAYARAHRIPVVTPKPGSGAGEAGGQP